VALGAAIQSALDHAVSSAQIVVDVAAHSRGVAALGREDEGRLERHMAAYNRGEEEEDDFPYPYTFAPVIRKNSRLPARFVEEFSTTHDGQEGIEVVVLQGESSNTRENTLVGAFHVELSPRPANSPVYIGFEYDQSGMVRVTVSDQGSDKPLKAHTLDLGASTQSNSELSSLRRLSGARDKDEDLPADAATGAPAASPAQLSNFLIEQVERQLAAVPAGEMADIRASLASYRELLAAGRDDEIDELEERLYAWLDEQKSS
jgi:molecular chaperone DnaK (HSP70)